MRSARYWLKSLSKRVLITVQPHSQRLRILLGCEFAAERGVNRRQYRKASACEVLGLAAGTRWAIKFGNVHSAKVEPVVGRKTITSPKFKDSTTYGL